MKHTPEEIKNRLSNIGEAIGGVALEYIAELEQENKVLTQNLEDTEIVNKALEKENAELKSGCGMCYRKDKENLTKAKELLKFWVDDFYDGFNSSIRYEERHKAIIESEQFLKENKK